MATEEEQNPYDIQDPAEGGEEILNEVMEEKGLTAENGEQPEPSDNHDGADEPSGTVETEENSEVVDDGAHDEVDHGEEIPANLVREAEQLGFSQEDIQSFGDAAGLERALVVFNRQLAARGRPDEPGTQEPEKEPQKETPKLELPEINLEEVDPEIAKYIEGQSKVIQDLYGQVQGLSGLQEQVQTLHAQEQQRQIEAFTSTFDGFIDNLGDSWDDVFGKKAGDPDKARADLMNEVSVLAAGYEATGREMPTADDLINRALRSLHGDRFQNLARKELNGKLKQRARQGIARPSNRKATDMTPEDRAARAVAEKMAEKGFTEDGAYEQPTF